MEDESGNVLGNERKMEGGREQKAVSRKEKNVRVKSRKVDFGD